MLRRRVCTSVRAFNRFLQCFPPKMSNDPYSKGEVSDLWDICLYCYC